MRWIAYVTDPTAGGSTFDTLAGTEPPPIAIPAPTAFVPATSANMAPNLELLDRTNEVRGRRANTAPISFASAPSGTIEGRAYPKVLRTFAQRALGGTISSEGVAPAAITSKFGTLQEGNLPALVLWLVREGQLDRLTGAVLEELELNFPINEEGTFTATFQGLFLDVDNSASPEDPKKTPAVAYPVADYTGHDYSFMLRDAKAFRGAGAGTEIPNLAGFSMTFNNGLEDEFRSRFRPGHNIQKTTLDTVVHKLWWPNRHKIGPQEVTGTINLSEVDSDAEAKHLLTHAEKLVFEIAAGPLGTTPPADEMMRVILYKHALTGGGAEPLAREGDQVSSYEFTAYLDETSNKDIEFEFVGKTAIT